MSSCKVIILKPCNKLRMRLLTLFLFYLVSFLCAPHLGEAVSVGADLLSAAEDFIQLVDYEKADQYTDKAITALVEDVAQGVESSDILAKAYYVKAYVLLAMAADKATLEAMLRKAVDTAPQFTPPEAYISPSDIASLLLKIRESRQAEICNALPTAQSLLEKGDFCAAFEIACPMRGVCPDQQQMVDLVLQVSTSNCPTYNVQSPCPGQSGARPARIANAPEGTGRIAVFPLIIKDISGELHSMVSAFAVSDYMGDLQQRYVAVVLDPATIRAWNERNDLRENYEKYLVREYQINPSISGKSLVSGKLKKEDVPVGGVPTKYADAIRDICMQTNAEYILFTLVKKKTGEDYFDFWACLYNASAPAKPVINELWKRLRNTSQIKDRMERLIDTINNDL